MEMQPMTLRCFGCGKTKSFGINRLPQFGFELAEIAQKVGWIFGFDFLHHRTLVFCSKECDEKSQTKTGYYRARPVVALKSEAN